MKILLLMIIVLLVSCSSTKYASQTTGGNLIGGSFSMEDHNGNTVTDKNYHGKYTMVFFGFTSCGSVCPLGLNAIAQTLNRLPKNISKQIQPIFITVDPERDTNEVIKEYVKLYHKSFIGLRGSADDVDDLVRKYRGYYRKVYKKDGKDYSMDHSDVIYLMGKDGTYRSHFSAAIGAKKIAERIEKIINNE